MREQGEPATPVGYVLPVQRWVAQGSERWVSEIWQTPRGGLFLVPGESPIGSRLPLSALPALRALDYPYVVPADPMREREQLPDPQLFAEAVADRRDRVNARDSRCSHGPSAAVVAAAPASGVPVRTALTMEAREGSVFVFMHTLTRLESYLRIIYAYETTYWEHYTTI